MHKAFLLLGSNANSDTYIRIGKDLILATFDVLKCSDIYETRSTLNASKTFLNMGILIATTFTPQFLKQNKLDEIEKHINGIDVIKKHDPRALDIDLCLFDNSVFRDSVCNIPDPDILTRHFKAYILSQLEPDYIFPGTKTSLSDYVKAFSSYDKKDIRHYDQVNISR